LLTNRGDHSESFFVASPFFTSVTSAKGIPNFFPSSVDPTRPLHHARIGQWITLQNIGVGIQERDTAASVEEVAERWDVEGGVKVSLQVADHEVGAQGVCHGQEVGERGTEFQKHAKKSVTATFAG
jgi:hypothetical protein